MLLPFKSLKFKIAGNLAVVILLAILLTDFVVINIVQKNLINSRIELGRSILSVASYGISDSSDVIKSQFTNTIIIGQGIPSFKTAYFYLETNMEYLHGKIKNSLSDNIKELTVQTYESCQSLIRYDEKAWGIFWQKKKYVLISAPITDDNGICIGAKTIVLQIDDLFQSLRQSQKIIVLYAIANFIILLLLGIYRMSRLIVKPIHQFIKKTDAYREKDRLYFTHSKNYQEFNQLSKALNHMVDTIETDKENLQNSLKELERTNIELKNAQNEMVKAEKLVSVGRLSAGIAHEIGNPIGIVLGYLDLLKSRPNLKKDEVGQDFLKRAQDEINRINTVIRQLLDFSRSTAVDCKIFSMHDLIQDVASMMSEQPFMSDIIFDSRLGDISNTVNADSEQIRQVLINLLINAADSIKTSEKEIKGIIRIVSGCIPENENSAVGHNSTFYLQVIDNGTGISREEIEYIFDPFFTTKEPGKGTGLGLSVSYMILEQAGGRITVESEPGLGTTMTIHLPISKNIIS